MSATDRFADRIEVRCSPDEKAAFTASAQSAGLRLSDWIRLRLRDAAGDRCSDATRSHRRQLAATP